MSEEAGIDPGIAQGERVAVHLDRSVHQRPDQLLGGVLEPEQIGPVPPALQRGHGDERLDRAVPGPGAEAGQPYVDLRDAVVAGYDDPAEIFTVSFRMTGRLHPQHPELVRVMLNTGPRVLVHDAGLAPRARRDIAAAKEAGRFDVDNVDLALMAAGGAMLGLLQLLESQPDADAAALTDQMTFSVLRMFGMTKREAAKLCSRPLPPQPEL